MANKLNLGQGDKAEVEVKVVEDSKGDANSINTDTDKAESNAEDDAEKAEDKVHEQTHNAAFAKQGGSDENDPLLHENQVEAARILADGASVTDNADSAGDLAIAEDAERNDGNSTTYSSSPISNFKIGKFQFERGQLTLKGEERQEFEELLKNSPTREQATVKKIDTDAAEKVATSFLETRMNRGVDTSDTSDDLPRSE